MISPFRLLRRQRRRELMDCRLIPESVWLSSLRDLPLCRFLSSEERERLRRLSTLFVHEKIFEPADGMKLDDRVRTRIAALACLPILNLDFDCYDGWRTVVIYPGGFKRPRSECDDIGVMHEWEDVLAGESWEPGPVILSWMDVQGSGYCEGYNVVIHEMAHKLDMLNGAADGFPALHHGMSRQIWADVFTAAFEDFNARVDRDEGTLIDPYAAETPGEFFAVLSEYFFEQPGLVRVEYPAIYDLLAQYYRQDPAARFGSSLTTNPFHTRYVLPPRVSPRNPYRPPHEALVDTASGDDHGRFEND